MGLPQFHPLAVADLRRETADCVSVAFALPDALRREFAFTPGQYLTLRATIDGEECRRSYSICTSPDEDELRVAIKRLDGGAFSTWANETLRGGDTVELMPPDGRFGIPAGADGRTYAAFAAGSGITPMMPIIRTVLVREPHSRVFLFYGNRSTASIIFREQLEDLKDRYLARLSVFHVLSREQQDIAALNGRLDAERVQLLMRGMVPPEVDHALVCGPFAMIEGLEKTLLDLGLPRERVHVERFTPAPGGRPRPLRTAVISAAPKAIATVIAEGARTDIPVAEGETIIEAGERAGLSLPYSCRGGMCCTCRARVLEGRVEMAVNYSLEPWETDAGFVLTCQSTPVTELVTIDYDQL